MHCAHNGRDQPVLATISRHAVSSTTRTPSASALARFDPASAPATTRSVRADTDPATFAPSASACARASSRVRPVIAPVKTTVLPVSAVVRAAVNGCGAHFAEQVGERIQIVRLGEEIDQRFGDHGADAADIGEAGEGVRVARCRQRGIAQGLDRAEIARQIARGALADMADADGEQEAVEADSPPVLDRGEEIVDRFRLEALAGEDRRAVVPQPEDVAGTDDQRRAAERPRLREQLDALAAQPSISKARRETKWRRRSLRCAAQVRPPVQRRTTASASRTAVDPHTGQ